MSFWDPAKEFDLKARVGAEALIARINQGASPLDAVEDTPEIAALRRDLAAVGSSEEKAVLLEVLRRKQRDQLEIASG